MDIFEVINKRRSVRGYEDKPIPEDDLQKILEAARMAPSNFNSQLYKIIIVRKVEARKKLAELSGMPFIATAPLILAVAITMKENKYAAQDVAIMLDHVMLAAAALGLGTVYIGAYHNLEIAKFLELPDSADPVALMPIGYAADREIPKRRKEMTELLSDEKF